MWSDEWSELEGHQYKFFSDLSITANGGRDQCYQHGGLLVSINTREEQEFIQYKVLRKRTLSAFIGGSDRVEGKCNYRVIEYKVLCKRILSAFIGGQIVWKVSVIIDLIEYKVLPRGPSVPSLGGQIAWKVSVIIDLIEYKVLPK